MGIVRKKLDLKPGDFIKLYDGRYAYVNLIYEDTGQVRVFITDYLPYKIIKKAKLVRRYEDSNKKKIRKRLPEDILDDAGQVN